MRIKPEKFIVNPEKPFDGDLLEREKTCIEWTQFIEQPNTPFVLAIDAEWGNGKTTFLEMWKAYLKNEGFKTVFFDAWEADFYDEALPALISEIQGQFKSEARFMEKSKQLVERLPVKGILQIVTSLIPFVGEEVSKAFELKLKEYDRVSDYSAYREAVNEFKEELREIAEKERLVIFIDELDRCRPIFALEVLEKVKHIFDVEGVFFVIAVNKGALIKTIKSEYGQIDGNLYLEKFFDKTMILKSNQQIFIEGLIKGMGGIGDPRAFVSSVKMFLSVVELFNLSLREQKKVIDICCRMDKQKKVDISNQWEIFPILIFFSALKIVNPNLFNKMLKVSVIEGDVDSMIFPSSDIQEFLDEKMKPYEHSDPLDNKAIDTMYTFVSLFVAKLNDTVSKIEIVQPEVPMEESPIEVPMESPIEVRMEQHRDYVERLFRDSIGGYSQARRLFDNILTLIEVG